MNLLDSIRKSRRDGGLEARGFNHGMLAANEKRPRTRLNIAQWSFRPFDVNVNLAQSFCSFAALRDILLATALIFTLAASSQTRPNILWINLDDLGRELSCYGNPDVSTPHMDKLAVQGMRFTNAYANAPVCSSSRSSQILGMYPSAASVLDHRTIDMRELPDGVVPVMELFRAAGYFCTNANGENLSRNGKVDYNFITHNLFDGTDWSKRAEGQPFFAQVQIHWPHRAFGHDTDNPIHPDKVTIPDSYFYHPMICADWALYLESIQLGDKIVGEIMTKLEEEGDANNTVVFLFGDNGRPHLRDKQWLYEGGLQIPLIVRWPEHIKANKTNKELISLVDVTASSLAAAGIEIPDYMHGKNVLGGEKRDYMYGFRQRCGDAPDDIRSITDGRYKLIWNRQPENPYMILSSYKKAQYPAWSLYTELNKKGELPAPYNQFMAKSRAEFELYDLKKDPNEFNNLAGQKKYAKIQEKLFGNLSSNLKVWEKDMIVEPAVTIQKAKEGSGKYFKTLMKKAGLPEDATEEELLEYWEKMLID